MKHKTCQCEDSGCPAHKGKSYCRKPASIPLRRIDLGDKTPVWFCCECAADASESGLFSD